MIEVDSEVEEGEVLEEEEEEIEEIVEGDLEVEEEQTEEDQEEEEVFDFIWIKYFYCILIFIIFK